MILLSDEFAFLTYLSHEGGGIPQAERDQHDAAIVNSLLALQLLKIADGRVLLTDSGRAALETGEIRDGVSLRYVTVSESCFRSPAARPMIAKQPWENRVGDRPRP